MTAAHSSGCSSHIHSHHAAAPYNQPTCIHVHMHASTLTTLAHRTVHRAPYSSVYRAVASHSTRHLSCTYSALPHTPPSCCAHRCRRSVAAPLPTLHYATHSVLHLHARFSLHSIHPHCTAPHCSHHSHCPAPSPLTNPTTSSNPPNSPHSNNNSHRKAAQKMMLPHRLVPHKAADPAPVCVPVQR